MGDVTMTPSTPDLRDEFAKVVAGKAALVPDGTGGWMIDGQPAQRTTTAAHAGDVRTGAPCPVPGGTVPVGWLRIWWQAGTPCPALSRQLDGDTRIKPDPSIYTPEVLAKGTPILPENAGLEDQYFSSAVGRWVPSSLSALSVRDAFAWLRPHPAPSPAPVAPVQAPVVDAEHPPEGYRLGSFEERGDVDHVLIWTKGGPWQRIERNGWYPSQWFVTAIPIKPSPASALAERDAAVEEVKRLREGVTEALAALDAMSWGEPHKRPDIILRALLEKGSGSA
jgi:hypothetical protein